MQFIIFDPLTELEKWAKLLMCNIKVHLLWSHTIDLPASEVKKHFHVIII